jgi:hypothetical protein
MFHQENSYEYFSKKGLAKILEQLGWRAMCFSGMSLPLVCGLFRHVEGETRC